MSSKFGNEANGNSNLNTEVFDATTVPTAGDGVASINNTLNSLVSNCDELKNIENIHTSNNFWAQRAFFETELSNTQGWATSKLVQQGFQFETANIDQHHARQAWIQGSATKLLYEKMAKKLLTCDQLRIPGCSVPIRLPCSKNDYAFQNAVADPTFTVEISKISFLSR